MVFGEKGNALAAHGAQAATAGLDPAAPLVPEARREPDTSGGRRVLLATVSRRLRKDLSRVLGAEGHVVVHCASRGAMLVMAIQQAGPLAAVVIDQALLGSGWTTLLRQLRRPAPSLPVVLLLRPGAEWARKLAFAAGAFAALPASATTEAVLDAVARAITAPEERCSPEFSRRPGTTSGDRLGTAHRGEGTAAGSGTGAPKEEPPCTAEER